MLLQPRLQHCLGPAHGQAVGPAGLLERGHVPGAELGHISHSGGVGLSLLLGGSIRGGGALAGFARGFLDVVVKAGGGGEGSYAFSGDAEAVRVGQQHVVPLLPLQPLVRQSDALQTGR
jgi:hypothetical protein